MKNQFSKKPPHWVIRILYSICPSDLIESIEGDLTEKFRVDYQNKGKFKARVSFFINAIKFLRPGILLRRNFRYTRKPGFLLGNYLTITRRIFLKNKSYSLTNILGLAMGISACLLIAQYVSYHLSFDKFQGNYDRIYRVTNDRYQEGKLVQHGTITYPTIGPAMKEDFPEVEMCTRMMPAGVMTAKVGDEFIRGGGLFYADQYFFKVFSFSLLFGDINEVLSKPFQIALSESEAVKLFHVNGSELGSLIGKTIQLLDKNDYQVIGIFKDVPGNSHLQFDALASYKSLYNAENTGADESWDWSDFYHYLLLKPGTNANALQAKFDDFSKRHFNGDQVSGSIEKFFLQPLKDIHLYSDYEYDFAITENGIAVWALALIAAFILLLAWINYINLTTARAIDRVKEIGVRQTLGAGRGQVLTQFTTESFFLCFTSLVLAIVAAIALQPSFNNVTHLHLDFLQTLTENPASFGLGLAGILLAGVVSSGVISMILIMAYKPNQVLKGRGNQTPRGQFLRKFLVIIQFSISSILIIGTLVVGKQLRFMRDSDLGLSINNKLVLLGPGNMQFDSTFISRMDNFKEAMMDLSFVKAAATSNRLPGQRLGRGFNFRLKQEPKSAERTMSWMGVDYNFFKTYNVKILAGRGFKATDHNASYAKLNSAIINEKAAHFFGYDNPEDIIGQQIYSYNNKEWTIIGVVNNFHQESFHNALEPIVFFPFYGSGNYITLELNDTNYDEILAIIKPVYMKYFPGNVFDYSFLQESYQELYSKDNEFAYVSEVFTGLALIISILGLMGLASYSASKRVKELSIRKVLGASSIQLINRIGRDFIFLIGIAILIAIPFSYLFMQRWLNRYAYKINLSWELFLIPVFLIIIVAIITVLLQVYKVANANPAETLKNE